MVVARDLGRRRNGEVLLVKVYKGSVTQDE